MGNAPTKRVLRRMLRLMTGVTYSQIFGCFVIKPSNLLFYWQPLNKSLFLVPWILSVVLSLGFMQKRQLLKGALMKKGVGFFPRLLLVLIFKRCLQLVICFIYLQKDCHTLGRIEEE
ncbi:hypothetical protein ACFX19_022061 [Malus domestica]